MTNAAQWPQIIRDLQREHGISERAIARNAKVNRSALRRVLSGNCEVRIGDLERILSSFGYDLEAIAIQRGSARCR